MSDTQEPVNGQPEQPPRQLVIPGELPFGLMVEMVRVFYFEPRINNFNNLNEFSLEMAVAIGVLEMEKANLWKLYDDTRRINFEMMQKAQQSQSQEQDA